MPKRFTHTECFNRFGTKPANVQWSWSARNEETKTVAVTLWKDEFRKAGELQVYERGPAAPDLKSRPGHSELMNNLRWALNKCEGRISVIIALAKDVRANPRSIAECYPTKMRAKVTMLDEASGAFRIETF